MLVTFSLTLFLSAGLLFSLQPMFAKLVLPLLGGVPTVWNTAMLFYQGVLLLGYAYVHLSSRWLPLRAQVLLQIILLCVTVLTLPVALVQGWQPPVEGTPVFWLLGLFAVSIGLPFFTVSTTAPLLQRWFSLTTHRDAENPYFLYASSNLGSMAALLSYPVLIEPYMQSVTQTRSWSLGFLVLCLALAACMVFLYKQHQPGKVTVQAATAERIAWRQRMHWTVLAFVPSSLLLGVTSFITTELATVPLLWVIPLALYLLTFVIVFSRKPIIKHDWMVKAQPLFILPLVITYKMSLAELSVFIPLHLGAFFLFAMVCHGELGRRRPDPVHLTEFYFWLSVGGVLGGLFNAILAPMVFDTILEYPIAMVLACLLRPMLVQSKPRDRWLDVVLPIAVLAVLQIPGLGPLTSLASSDTLVVITVMLAGLAVYTFSYRPLRFSLGVMAILVGFTMSQDSELLTRERSFFGVHKVSLDKSGDFHVLYHGTTIHGAEHRDPALHGEPLTYYHRGSPISNAFATIGQGERLKRVALVGVGAGAATCYRSPGQAWDLFEIDETVMKLARDSRYFNYLSECAPNARLMLGDARLMLMQAEDHYYDMILLDAYSSDAVPVHLVTREAVALYKQKLADGGVIAINISNRYLDLGRLFATQMADANLAAVISLSPEQSEALYSRLMRRFIFDSQWIVAARTHEELKPLPQDLWMPLEPVAGQRVWTDDYSNLLKIVRFD